MRRLLFISLFMMQLSGSWAQGLSPASFAYEFRSDSEIKQKGSLSFALPVFMSDKNVLVVSPQYSHLGLSDSFPFSASDFHQATVRFAWMHRLNEQWKAILLLAPALSSDFKDLSGSDMIRTSGLRFLYTRNYRTSYSLGLLYAYRFSNHLIIPMVGIHRDFSDKFMLDANLPFDGRLTYVCNPSVRTGLFFSAEQWVSGTSDDPATDYIWLQERSLGLFADRMMLKNWWLKLQVGYNLKCDLDAYRGPDNAKWQFGANLTNTGLDPVYEYSESGFLLNISVAFRFAGSKTSEAF